MEDIFTIKMSSKKNKSKSKRASEGDSSNDSCGLTTSGQEGGRSRSLSSHSFTVIDFIDKGESLGAKTLEKVVGGVKVNKTLDQSAGWRWTSRQPTVIIF